MLWGKIVYWNCIMSSNPNNWYFYINVPSFLIRFKLHFSPKLLYILVIKTNMCFWMNWHFFKNLNFVSYLLLLSLYYWNLKNVLKPIKKQILQIWQHKDQKELTLLPEIYFLSLSFTDINNFSFTTSWGFSSWKEWILILII